MFTQLFVNLFIEGLIGLSQLIRKLSLPTFANWRWSTLKIAVAALCTVWESVRDNFPSHLFTKCKDQSRFNKVMQCVRGVMWELHMKFVNWFCDGVCQIQDWIGGCDCHEDDLLAGLTVTCDRKGKRMSTAYTYAVGRLRCILNAATSWTAAHFNGDYGMTAQAHSCIRFAFALGLEKLEYLNTLPWLFARLDQPGVTDKCIEQWGAVPPNKHHARTVLVMSPDGDVRADFDMINNDGTGITFKVRQAVRPVRDQPMDDTIGEGPHAIARRHFLHARRAQWPYIAATCRMTQDFDDVDRLLPAVGGDLETEWRRYKSVLQLNRCFLARNVRMSPHAFANAVYRMGHVLGDDASAEDVDDDVAGTNHSHMEAYYYCLVSLLTKFPFA
jgi:hypothetical protein